MLITTTAELAPMCPNLAVNYWNITKTALKSPATAAVSGGGCGWDGVPWMEEHATSVSWGKCNSVALQGADGWCHSGGGVRVGKCQMWQALIMHTAELLPARPCTVRLEQREGLGWRMGPAAAWARGSPTRLYRSGCSVAKAAALMRGLSGWSCCTMLCCPAQPGAVITVAAQEQDALLL